MFLQTVGQHDYIFHCLVARRDRRSANSAELEKARKSPCLSHFFGISLSEKRPVPLFLLEKM
jgi:hypothetical protein